ncbi:hypothetical protein ACFYU8_18695 [Brevibacillus sp. NPDC003359]|uniref:hypothetical protein n=1 Tax=unclassified Brevibacillus TaxID=2684853 RepID=UPI0036B86C23
MKKLVSSTVAILFVLATLVPTSLAYTKPSGNVCGKDDKTPGRSSTSQISYYKIPHEVEYKPDNSEKSKVSPLALDSWVYSSETKACGQPFPVEEYENKHPAPFTYTFTAKATKSTTYNASVTASFQAAFNATMGYQATNTVERASQFAVTVPTGTTVYLKASPSLTVIKGTWKYLTGSQKIDVYYPTHLKWITE